MTAALRHVPQVSVDLAEAFRLRCWACARLVIEGELALHEAVDKLHGDAVRDGLVAAIGQDRAQEMLAEAFCKVGTLTAWELGEAVEDHRGVLDAATLAELDALIEEGDPQQFREWMAWLTIAEREAVHDLLVTS
jgi:hypothetical protein